MTTKRAKSRISVSAFLLQEKTLTAWFLEYSQCLNLLTAREKKKIYLSHTRRLKLLKELAKTYNINFENGEFIKKIE